MPSATSTNEASVCSGPPDPPIEREPRNWRHNHELTGGSEVPHTLSDEHTEGWPGGAREERAENKNPHRRAVAPYRHRSAALWTGRRARRDDRSAHDTHLSSSYDALGQLIREQAHP